MPTWIVGAVLATGIALLAFRSRALSASGAVAAGIIGMVALGAGWGWGVILIAYFAAAVLLSRFGAAEKSDRSEGRVDKEGPRDARQVLSNGAVFSLAAVGDWVSPGALWEAVGAGALATSSADTWATELGTLSRVAPRSILRGQSVRVGTSGGVTTLGLAAGLAGAAFVATIASAVNWPAGAVGAAVAGGALGCLLDSVLGAWLQARRWCTSCGTATERRIHRCGARTRVEGGLPWLDNDGVNAISTVGGALVGTASFTYI